MSRTREQVAGLVRECLEEGASVDIDGLGTFRPDGAGGLLFVPDTQPRVFLAYVVEDAAAAGRLYDGLRAHGYDAWLDRKKLLPGQNWPRAIERAIEVSDFFVACFSRRAVSKRGRFQSELRYALDCAARVPLDEIYFIPVRLDECRVPARIRQVIQHVDLFPNWERGFARLLAAMRRPRRAPLARAV